MAEKKLLWLTGEKNPDSNQYEGVLIDAEDVYNAVCVISIRVWSDVSGNTKIEIPERIVWEDEEYNRLRDMGEHDLMDYLDSLVGQEGQDSINEHVNSNDCLVFDYESYEFSNLEDWDTYKAYDYFCNSNSKTIYLESDGYGYNEENKLEITSTYILDYIDYARNKTNFEYGGTGEHAKLHKVVIDGDKDDNRILWHEWSQWQGSELDMGCLMSIEDVLDRLENHPELEAITEWLRKES